jgi:hypothetical protein
MVRLAAKRGMAFSRKPSAVPAREAEDVVELGDLLGIQRTRGRSPEEKEEFGCLL